MLNNLYNINRVKGARVIPSLLIFYYNMEEAYLMNVKQDDERYSTTKENEYFVE